MAHHPSCPHYPVTRPCAFACHLIQPSSNAVYDSQAPFPKTPMYTAVDAVQPTRLIRLDFPRAANSLNRQNATSDRIKHHVSFEPCQTPFTNGNGGTYESRKQDRVRRRTTYTTPTSQSQIPRSILCPDDRFPPLPPPNQPTIYIVTFAADSIPNRPSNVRHLLDSQLPSRNPPIPHLYTIDARSFTPPLPALCRQYSGISPLIQDIVLQDPRAREAVEDSVSDVLRCGERGVREVSMSVCCHAGTHRSVAIGERIAQGVKAEVGRLGCVEGVRVVVRHVSRVKGKGDPF